MTIFYKKNQIGKLDTPKNKAPPPMRETVR